MTGSPDAQYASIRPCGLGRPPPSIALDKVSISGGQFLNIGLSASIGNRDKSPYIDYRDHYIDTLRAISRRHFLFYDVDKNRPWLIDGASTVLHLLRTFLEDGRTDERLRNERGPAFNKLYEAADDSFGADAAFDVLKQNRDQRIWLDDASGQSTSIFLIKHKVEQICTILQQITAHVDNMRNGAGYRLKLNPSHQLEGFDFFSLATDEGPIWPKVHTINAFGEGWVDFTRAIHAPTLFGRSFGDMFQPIDKICQTCKLNEPPGEELLAVSIADLKRIVDRHGNRESNPCVLAPNIIWHTPDRCLEPCDCSRASTEKRDRVQRCMSDGLHIRHWRGLRSPTGLFDGHGPYDRGAVLFEHRFKLPTRRGKTQSPNRSHATPEIVEPDSIDTDPTDTEYSASSPATPDSMNNHASSSRKRIQNSTGNSSPTGYNPQDNIHFTRDRSWEFSFEHKTDENDNAASLDPVPNTHRARPTDKIYGRNLAPYARAEPRVTQNLSSDWRGGGEGQASTIMTLRQAKPSMSETTWEMVENFYST